MQILTILVSVQEDYYVINFENMVRKAEYNVVYVYWKLELLAQVFLSTEIIKLRISDH